MTRLNHGGKLDLALESARETNSPASHPVALNANTNYRDVIDALFVQHAIERGDTTFVGSSWTSGCDPTEATFDRIAAASYDDNGAEELLARVGEGLAHVIVLGRSVTVRAAARCRLDSEAVIARVRELLPPDTTAPGHTDVTSGGGGRWAVAG